MDNFTNIMFAPLVSVIVPVYNMEGLLTRCVDSILNQTYKNHEIILVDDGSTDSSLKICKQYEKQYENVSAISKENGGLSSARLAGFELAKGKYILFIDSDDYIHEDMISQLIESIESNQSDLAICGYYEKHVDTEVKRIPSFYSNVIQGRENIITFYIKPLIGSENNTERFPGFICCRLMKKELIERNFFQSERKYFMEDHVFDLLYADCVQSISIVETPLYYYCINQNSLTNRYRKNKWDMLENLYEFYTTYAKNRKIDDCERNLLFFLVFAFCISVDNAVLSGTYKSYMMEMNHIKKSNLIKKLDNFHLASQIPKTYRVTLQLYKYNLLLPLYYLRRSRLRSKREKERK